MTATATGLTKGTRVHVTHAGKYGTGTINRDSLFYDRNGAQYVSYRCDYNASERLAPVTAVRVMQCDEALAEAKSA